MQHLKSADRPTGLAALQAKAPQMAKVTVSIRHITWRDGRPRFEPGPTVRVLGYRGEDLKHPDGAWLSLAETQTWVEARMAEIAARRQTKASGVKIKPIRRGTLYTVEDVFDDLWKAQRFKPGRDGALRAGFGCLNSSLRMLSGSLPVLSLLGMLLWGCDARRA